MSKFTQGRNNRGFDYCETYIFNGGYLISVQFKILLISEACVTCV